MEAEVTYKVNKSDLIELFKEVQGSKYDPVFGLKKDDMMLELNIKSETTFYDRLRTGKILSKEVGGSVRYFLPI